VKKKSLLLYFFLALLAILSGIYGERTFRSILFLSELLNLDQPGWLGKTSLRPVVKEVSWEGARGISRADLYLPGPQGRQAGILLNHGVIDTGKDDPRLRRFATILCQAGFVVIVPDLKGMRSFRIAPSDVDEIRAAFSHFISRREVKPDSCGLFGFSYGAGPTIIAACQPEVRDRVRFVVSFGGYYDLKNVLSFIATGHFEFRGKRYFRKPQEYGKWVFLANNLDWVESPDDRAVLRKILKLKLRDEHAPIEPFLSQLGWEGKNVLNLLSHADPSQTDSLVRRLPPAIRSFMAELSVFPALKDLRAHLILAHGEDDDLVPFTETLRIAEAAPDPGKVYMKILKTFSHVDPEERPLTLKNLFSFYLPEGWKLFLLTFHLLGYR
jgi:dienelactone hydrolase